MLLDEAERIGEQGPHCQSPSVIRATAAAYASHPSLSFPVLPLEGMQTASPAEMAMLLIERRKAMGMAMAMMAMLKVMLMGTATITMTMAVTVTEGMKVVVEGSW